MKAFFEEYGLVLVVTAIAVGMITFADSFKDTMRTGIEDMWNNMQSETGK